MKTFVRSLLAFCALQGAVVVAVYALSATGPDHYLSANLDKQRRLRDAASPRVILVGGSGAAFGFDSKALGHALGRSPVNMGLHSDLSLDFMLREVEPVLREGDLVIVSPEYELLLNKTRGAELMVLLEKNPAVIRYMGWQRTRAVLDEGLVTIGRKFRYLFASAHDASTSQGSLEENVVYRRGAFNEYGDFVAHHGAVSTPKIVDDRVLVRGPAYLDAAIDRMNAFTARARERGAEVVFAPPAIPPEFLEANGEILTEVRKSLEQLDAQVLYEFEDVVYERSLFYDSVYHLTAEGAAQRTSLLIERLDGI